MKILENAYIWNQFPFRLDWQNYNILDYLKYNGLGSLMLGFYLIIFTSHTKLILIFLLLWNWVILYVVFNPAYIRNWTLKPQSNHFNVRIISLKFKYHLLNSLQTNFAILVSISSKSKLCLQFLKLTLHYDLYLLIYCGRIQFFMHIYYTSQYI